MREASLAQQKQSFVEKVARFSVKNRFAVLGGVLILALVSLRFVPEVRLDALPDITSNQVLVLTSATSLSPEEVELRITTPIELALAGMPGLIERRSISRFGISQVTAIFEDTVPAHQARALVSERLSSVRSRLPAEATEPELGPFTGGLGEIFHFTLRTENTDASSLMNLRELVQFRIAPILRKIPGVVEVNPWGGELRSLQVEANAERMAALGTSISTLESAVTEALGNVGGASLRDGTSGTSQVLLRGRANPIEPNDLANVRVTLDQTSVSLSQVAQTTTAGLPRIGAATQDGNGEVIYVMVQMIRDANALQVTDRIHEALPEIRRALPEGVILDLVYDRSSLVNATLRTMTKNLVEGGLLVALVLFLMLGSLRAGLLVAVVIPISMLFASFAMWLFGIGGNLMSLGALDFGLLVDGAVVMVERIFHVSHAAKTRPEGHAQSPAAEEATAFSLAWFASQTASVSKATAFSVLTILLVYVPVLSLTGVDGKMFRPMALVVVLALSFALLLSLTFVPASLAIFLREKDVPKRNPWMVRQIDRAYPSILGLAMKWPMVLLMLGTMLLAGGLFAWARAGSELAPQLNEGDLVVQTTRASEIRIESSVADSLEMERAVRRIPEVLRVTSRVGSPAIATDIMGLEQADVFIQLRDADSFRPGMTDEKLIQEIEEAIRSAPANSLSEVELSFTQPIQMRFNELMGGAVTDVVVSVFGEDLNVIRTVCTELAEVLRKVPGAKDIRVLAPDDVALLDATPNYAALTQFGLSGQDFLTWIQSARAGKQLGASYSGPQTIPIVLRVPQARTPDELRSSRLPTSGGGLVPFESIAQLETTSVPSLVQHQNGQRRLMVGFNVRGADLGTVVEFAKQRTEQELSLPRGMRLEWGGQITALEEATTRLLWVIPAVLAGIVFLLFWAFRNLKYVLVLLMHLPFATALGMIALYLQQMPFSISAAIGFIALSGIAIMNAMVLLMQLQTYEKEGMPPQEAVLLAANDRARPVLMTALVALLGFVPMMLSHGVGAEVQRPLATVVVFGLISSTLTTLVLMPSLYAWFSSKPWLNRQHSTNV